MAAGVGLFGTLSGLVASSFLSPAAKEADEAREDIKLLLVEVREILTRGHAPGREDGQAG